MFRATDVYGDGAGQKNADAHGSVLNAREGANAARQLDCYARADGVRREDEDVHGA